MVRSFTPKVVTANHLLNGDVIYLTAGRVWSRRLADAEVLTDPATAGARLALAGAEPEVAVGAYLADVRLGPHGLPEPTHLREALRAGGPSSYGHGQRADG